ncbi:MAG TPA: hypothetical protein VKY36_00665, partial [Moheibacter sp.]|nr:hypothetical protein [Moheibacter sp.]
MHKFKKIILRIFQGFLVLILLIVTLLYLTDNEYILRGVRLTYLKGHNTANIDDYKDFKNNIVLSGKPQPWPEDENYNKIPLTDSLTSELEKFQTVG